MEEQWEIDSRDALVVVAHLAEAEQSERLVNLPYVALGLPLHSGLDDPLLLA